MSIGRRKFPKKNKLFYLLKKIALPIADPTKKDTRISVISAIVISI